MLSSFFKTEKYLIGLLAGLFLFSNCSQEIPIDIPFSLSEFEDQLLSHEGNQTDSSYLEGKYLGIYFSAYWCPPCQEFTPKLVEFRNKNVEDFEVVFVSSDFDQEEQFNYIKEAKMKWLTLPIDSNVSLSLSEKFQVASIPTLVVISPDGKAISKDGHDHILNAPANAIENWKALASANADD